MNAPSTQHIVIAGGGSAGWMAAAALSRFLGGAATITLIESDMIGTVGVGEATIPQIHHFNNALGIPEAEFLRETNASFKLGIEFVGWREEGHGYIHGFGLLGRAVGILPFRDLWLKGRFDGTADELGVYNFNDVAARADRMIGLGHSPSSVRDLVYAYHFDATLYAAYLRKMAEARGVTRLNAVIQSVERDADSGDISALVLDGDRRVEGDFFIDCTGFRSVLLGETLGVPFDDWSHWLPCNRALAVPCERADPLHPYTRSTARQAGWQWRIPLQHRTGNGHVYCADYLSDDEATSILLDNLDGKPLGDPRPIKFTTGRRKEAWSHNCLALGLAAGFMEPLESTSLHLIQTAISRFLKMMPSSNSEQKVRDAFNRQIAMEWQQIRDFLILHYTVNQREGQPFWDYCRSMTLPDSLVEKIGMFEESGAVVKDDGELFTEEGWTQVMVGQGLEPRSYSPLARGIDGKELGLFLSSLAESYRQRAATLPTHEQWIEHVQSGRAAAAVKGAR
ncbi:tryptophan halogenase family protein [Sphingomonas jaspsi]|uniref:tryptophan halogenase family protein n=1 Tax=Sphingomonas jaspsi TaxID=392409 RepID=UPI0004B9C4B2|nr:tryptophan halogenase family protein [Sphingomonas jaspsi]